MINGPAAFQRIGDAGWAAAEGIVWILILAGLAVFIGYRIRSRRSLKEIEEVMKRGAPGNEGPRNPWEND